MRDTIVEYVYLLSTLMVSLALVNAWIVVTIPFGAAPWWSDVLARLLFLTISAALLWAVVWGFRRAPVVMSRRRIVMMAFVLIICGGIVMCFLHPDVMPWLGPALAWPWGVLIIIREFKFTKRY